MKAVKTPVRLFPALMLMPGYEHQYMDMKKKQTKYVDVVYTDNYRQAELDPRAFILTITNSCPFTRARITVYVNGMFTFLWLRSTAHTPVKTQCICFAQDIHR